MEKIEIDDIIKNEIINKYKYGISMRKIEKQYPYSFTFIQKLIKSYEWVEKIKINYSQKNGYNLIAICRKTGKEFNDYSNESGAITKHIILLYPNENNKSKYIRKSIEYNTGKFWYDEFFKFEYREEKKLKKCNYCDWVTEDISNLSGAYEKHLLKIHNIKPEEHIIKIFEDISYFKKLPPMDGIICAICGKKLRILNHKHLKKHNIGVYDYKLKYEENIVSDSTKTKLRNGWSKTLKNSSFKNISLSEKQIKDELSEINFITSDRKILGGLEIDLLSINDKIGIEIDGLYYHSEIIGKKEKNYHINKTNMANKAGFQLIHIFEDEIIMKKEIVINKLKHIFGINNSLKIHGRKCNVQEISSKEKSQFIEKYHIQGNSLSTHNIGAFYRDELVAVMSFSNNRNMNKTHFHTQNNYELVRFVTKSNYIINGIASKMLKYFISKYNPYIIISFADRRWTLNKDDNLYTKLGFKLITILKPDYSYVNFKISRNRRLHKFGFGKSSIKKRYPDIYDESKTEWEMMQELGYDRIWDCGKFKYELILEHN